MPKLKLVINKLTKRTLSVDLPCESTLSDFRCIFIGQCQCSMVIVPAARQANVREPEMNLYRLQIFAPGKCQSSNWLLTKRRNGHCPFICLANGHCRIFALYLLDIVNVYWPLSHCAPGKCPLARDDHQPPPDICLW
jgi:hypothetical protein